MFAGNTDSFAGWVAAAEGTSAPWQLQAEEWDLGLPNTHTHKKKTTTIEQQQSSKQQKKHLTETYSI